MIAMSSAMSIDNLETFVLRSFLGNTVEQWAISAAIFFTTWLLLALATKWLLSRARAAAEKTTTRLDNAWVEVVGATGFFGFVAASLFLAHNVLDLTRGANQMVARSLGILVGIQVGLWVQKAVSAFLQVWLDAQQEEPPAIRANASTIAGAVRFLSRLIIWTVLLLVVLSNLGVEITTIIAGLGVGGVAAALAVQQVLGDVIAGLSMYFDRPFDLGDFVNVGDVQGTVTKIGLRTTRIDGLGGEKVVYPNGKLASNHIRNFGKMQERRVLFGVGIEYGLPAEKLEQAGAIISDAIQKVEGIRFDRAHFKELGPHSLNFEAVYFVLSPDYRTYMDIQQRINMDIYQRFEEAKIPFAFPTQTLMHCGLGCAPSAKPPGK
jgi:small-conductance mechanosensitive channel